jgi:hypothetical protein
MEAESRKNLGGIMPDVPLDTVPTGVAYYAPATDASATKPLKDPIATAIAELRNRYLNWPAPTER